MSQSIIQTPPSAWIDITDQVTWHANKINYGMFYNPSVHMITGFVRLSSSENGAAIFSTLPEAYRPPVNFYANGVCATSNTDSTLKPVQFDIYTYGDTRINLPVNATCYNVRCSFTWICV